MEKQILYSFIYCPCIHESGSITMSVHFTKQGTEKALNEHREKELEEWNEDYLENNEFNFKFGENESWRIEEIEVLP